MYFMNYNCTYLFHFMNQMAHSYTVGDIDAVVPIFSQAFKDQLARLKVLSDQFKMNKLPAKLDLQIQEERKVQIQEEPKVRPETVVLASESEDEASEEKLTMMKLQNAIESEYVMRLDCAPGWPDQHDEDFMYAMSIQMQALSQDPTDRAFLGDISIENTLPTGTRTRKQTDFLSE